MSLEDAQTQRNLAAIARIREEMGWPEPDPNPEPVWYTIVTRGRNA